MIQRGGFEFCPIGILCVLPVFVDNSRRHWGDDGSAEDVKGIAPHRVISCYAAATSRYARLARVGERPAVLRKLQAKVVWKTTELA